MERDREQGRTDIPADRVRGWMWKALLLGGIVGVVGMYLYLRSQG